MAVYLNSKNIKSKNKKRNQKIGISLIVIFGVLFLNLAFNILKPVNSFFLGFFGISTYVIFLFCVALGVLYVCNRTVRLNSKQILVLILWFISFLMLVHLATSTKLLGPNYGQYLLDAYTSKLTAGGMLFSILVYPFYFASYMVGAFVLVSILFIIATSFLVYMIYDYFRNTKQQPKTEQPEIEEEHEEYIPQTVKEQHDDIVVADDYKQETVTTQLPLISQEEENKQKAREMLGINRRESKVEQPTFTINDYATSFREAKTQALNGRDILLPHEDKPVKYVHNMTENERSRHTLTEQERKNLEFLRATMGEALEPEEEEEPAIVPPAKQPEYIQPRRLDEGDFANLPSTLGEEDLTSRETDIYDENLTRNNYQQTYSAPQMEEIKPKEVKFSLGKPAIEESQVEEDEIIEEEYTMPAKPVVTAKIEPEPMTQAPRARYKQTSKYIKPPIDLLNVIKNDENTHEDYTQKARMLEQTLESFRIPAKVVSITRGPAFTRFELQMPQGIPVKKVLNYTDDLSMALESQGDVRIEVPIAGKNAFGVEVPNDKRDIVGIRDIIESYNFESNKSKLTFGLGKDITGECKVAKLDKMPHLLVAGSTGSGKSVCLNTMLISLIYKSSPEEVRFLLIDPKRVEFSMYNNLPHLLIPNVITDIDKAIKSLQWAIDEMERRFEIFSQNMVRNLDEYSQLKGVVEGGMERLPYIVIIVDEFGDLISQNKKEVEEKIQRLVQKSRAAGIHVVLATQRPSVNVITGTIKNNLNARIAFAVTSVVDSKTILDQGGAEKLLGKGDMLLSTSDSPDLVRIQGAFISNKEVEDVVNFVKENNEANFDSDIEEKMFNRKNNSYDSPDSEEFDPLLKDAVRMAIKYGNISISKIQRMFGVGYPRGGKIIDQMEKAGFISTTDNKNQRQIFITEQEFEERFGEDL